MAGYRAAGWTCCGALVLSLLVAIVGMRDMGIVGQQTPTPSEKSSHGVIELSEIAQRVGDHASTQVVDGAMFGDVSEGETGHGTIPINERGGAWTTPTHCWGQHGVSLSKKLKVFEEVV